MRAGSRRGVLGSVGHGAGRDHVCSQVVTERYSLRMYARGSERTSEFRPVWHPRNPASGSRRRTAGGSASYARRHAARPPEREDDEDPDPRSDDEIFVVPRKIRYALRARRRNRWCVARSVRYRIYLIIPVRRAFIAFWLIVRVRSDPCTCTVERSTPTTT